MQTRTRHQHEHGDRKRKFIRKTTEIETDDVPEDINRIKGESKTEESPNNIDASSDSVTLQQIFEKLSELTDQRKYTRGAQPRKRNNGPIICYACNQENHFARDCPFKTQGGRNEISKQMTN
jgi:hypothetical protein